MKDSSRYQHQRWYIKLWRRRHYLRIPFIASRIWWYSPEDRGHAWDIATGLIHGDMEWWYTSEEVEKRLEKVVANHMPPDEKEK
jgi:hypothetical protein